MAILALDTSTTVCTVALSEADKLLVEHVVNIKNTHSESLMPQIAEVLKQAEYSLQDCQAVAVVEGPGSFTGLRIGLATAKGLALSANLHMITLTSLEVLAHNVSYSALPVVSLLSAQRGEVYIGHFSCEAKYPRLLADYFVGKIGDELHELMAGKEFVAVGEGALQFKKELINVFGSQVHFLAPAHNRTRAGLVASLAYHKLQQGQFADVITSAPRYLRLSSAEQRRLEQKAGECTC